jgi:16S rRNA (uracil1498-N3)-methyltransferase
MATRRFHVAVVTPGRIRVQGGQAAHGLKALRLGIGDEVVVFDGSGAEATGKIAEIEREAFEIEVICRSAPSEWKRPCLTIATAIPKGERADWMIEKCAELGVTRLIPLACKRSQVHPGAAKLERWRRKAVEAAKQSRQSKVMEIGQECPIGELAAQLSSSPLLLFGDGGAVQSMNELLSNRAAEEDCITCIGPEGGFDDDERELLRSQGSIPVCLGGTVLRVETAALAAAAIWASWAR